MSITRIIQGASMLFNEDPDNLGGTGPSDQDPSNPPVYDASGIFDHEGKFADIGEKFSSDEVDSDYINRYFKGKTPTEVASSLKANQAAARQKSLVYPGEDATEAQHDAWRQGALVPEKIEQVMPEDFESFQKATGWTPEVATPVIQAMIDAGSPGPVITAAINAVQQAASTQGEAWATQVQETQEASRAEVDEAFGTEADSRISAASTAAEKLALKAGLTQEQIDDVKAGVEEIRNPAITRMFAHLSDAIEQARYRGKGAESEADDYRGPAEIAQAIMEDPSHAMHEKYLSGDDDVHNYVDGLLDKARKLKS